MSLKTLANKATSKVGKQVLIAQKHSPTFLIAIGIAGVTTATFLACKATLKLSDVVTEAEGKIAEAHAHMDKSFEVSHDGTDKDKERFAKAKNRAAISLKTQTAIKIVKLYAPSSILLAVSVGALTGSHLILQKRNAGLAAAYTIVQKGFNDYRGRVIADQGAEKDLEYRFGTNGREVVEDGPNGPEVKWIEGPDQKALQAAEEETYARVFAPRHADGKINDNWSEIPMQNQYFITMVLGHARDALETKGYIFLNDVYDMLGFERTIAGSEVGWIKGSKINPVTGEQETDGYIDFGLWNEGIYKGKSWVNGNPEAFLLDFNVDGPIRSQVLARM